MQVVANLEVLNEISVDSRFKQGNTAIIIARADHISTGCRFEFTSIGGQSCCYTSVLGHSLDHQQDLCLAPVEKKKVEEEKMTCRDNSTFLVEEVRQNHWQNHLFLFRT